MTYRNKPFLTFVCALAGLLFLATGATTAGHSAHAQSPVMRIDPASQTVDIGDGYFSVDILIDNVTNLGAYDIELTFDPNVLTFVGIEDRGFLGTSGRQAHCPHVQTTTTTRDDDTLRFGCGSNLAEPPGPDGSGILATVTFEPAGAGNSPLVLGPRSGWAPPLINGITSIVTEGGEVTVVGVGPTATPKPGQPTRTSPGHQAPVVATPTPSNSIDLLLTPDPGETSMSRPMPGRQLSKPSADGLTAASTDSSNSSGGASGGNHNSPRAGTGPEKETSRWPTVTGLILMAGGVLLLFFAAYTRRGRKHSAG